MFNKTVVISFVLSINILLAGDNTISSLMQQDISTIKRVLKDYSIYKRYKNKKTLLHYAVEADNYEAVSFLVDKNIPLSAQGGKYLNTALQDAIYQGRLKIANLLIEKGTPPNIQNIYGDTALHIATRLGYLGIVKKLISHGASRGIVNNLGKTASDLIPKLTWDSYREFKKSLKKEKTKLKQPINSRSRSSIDIKSSIQNSTIGISIQGEDYEKFR